MAATTILGQESAERSLTFSPDRDVWHEDAPEAIRRGYQSLDDQDAWRQWVQHLNGRRRPKRLRKILPAGSRCLLLSGQLGDEAARDEEFELISSLGKSVNKDISERAEAWLDKTISVESDSQELLKSLAWCHALPRLALHVPATLWWRVLGRLIDLNDSAHEIEPNDWPLAWQLLGGELALSLGYLFPELQARDGWRRQGQETVSNGLGSLLSPEGMPHASHLPLLGELIACWTRCAAVCKELPGDSFPRETRKVYRRAVLGMARLTREGDDAPLEIAFGGPVTKKLLKAAARVAGSSKCTAAVRAALGKSSKRAKLPDCSLNSERAQTALLRTDWRQQSPRLALTYAHRHVETELSCGEVLWSGEWRIELARDHQNLSIESSWDEVCAESDEDVDYVELEARFSGGVRVQRHMLLVKEDQFLFLADAVISSQPGSVDYCSVLPLSKRVSLQFSEETTEVQLDGRKPRVRILPLALSEWRSERRFGTLTATDRGLELRQAGMGPCLFAPMLVDLTKKRFDKPLTWRQLTVAEQRQIVSPGEAVGYRVQMGRKQWLIYRSLARLATRSVLGQNLANEFFFGRFLADTGEAEMLLEIEP